VNLFPLLFAFSPILRDLLPSFVFIGILKIGGGPLVATSSAMVIGSAHVAWSLVRRAPIAALQWMSLVLVLIFGGATLATHDPRFLMAKPTLIFIAVGITMLKPGWQKAYVPPIARPHLADDALAAWGFGWAGLMFALAAANAAFALLTPLETWAAFSAFGPMIAILLLFGAQYLTLRTGVARAIRADPPAAKENKPTPDADGA